jgi:hypothetical protein
MKKDTSWHKMNQEFSKIPEASFAPLVMEEFSILLARFVQRASWIL